jgi:hypothetical protein
MRDMDLGTGECGRYAVVALRDASGIAALMRGRRHARDAGGDVLLAAPQRLVRRVLAIIIWECDGFAVHPSAAAAAASARASAQAVAPIRRQPTRMRDNASPRMHRSEAVHGQRRPAQIGEVSRRRGLRG